MPRETGHLRIGQFAARVNRSADTVRRWDKTGLLPARRSDGGQRYYTDADVRTALRGFGEAERATVGYLRATPGPRATDDIARQRQILETFVDAEQLSVDEWLTDIALGRTADRDGLKAIIDRIALDSQPVHILAFTADRLTSFGFDLLGQIIAAAGGQITVVRPGVIWSHAEASADIAAATSAHKAALALSDVTFPADTSRKEQSR